MIPQLPHWTALQSGTATPAQMCSSGSGAGSRLDGRSKNTRTPMAKDTLYLACYDVADDRERERVADVLEGVGLRVQRSVFECRLTRSARERVLEGLRALHLQSGFVS